MATLLGAKHAKNIYQQNIYLYIFDHWRDNDDFPFLLDV